MIADTYVEPVRELAANHIASNASRAALELDDLRYWKEERERRRPLSFTHLHRLVQGLKAVLESLPDDASYFRYRRSGVAKLTCTNHTEKSNVDLQKWGRSVLQNMIDRLSVVTEETDIDIVTDLRDLCIEVSRSSSPYEGIAIRR